MSIINPAARLGWLGGRPYAAAGFGSTGPLSRKVTGGSFHVGDNLHLSESGISYDMSIYIYMYIYNALHKMQTSLSLPIQGRPVGEAHKNLLDTSRTQLSRERRLVVNAGWRTTQQAIIRVPWVINVCNFCAWCKLHLRRFAHLGFLISFR